MATYQPSNNFGIVAGFSAATSTVYTDARSQTVATIVATNAYQKGQGGTASNAQFSVGRGDRLLLRAHAGFAGGMTTWTFYVRLVYDDPQGNAVANSITFGPSEIAIQRADGTDSPSVAKALVVGNFTGTDGAACDVAFITTNAFAASGQCEVMVKGNQGAASGDFFYLTAELAGGST